MDLADTPSIWHYALRRQWQRRATNLPIRVAPWHELIDPAREAARGVFHARPGFSGILRHEPGQPFTIEPVRYHGRPARLLPSDNRRYFASEPDRVVYALSEAGVYTRDGTVYDVRSRTVVAETLEAWEHDAARHPMFAAPRFPRRERLPGRTFLFGRAGTDTFYHFLVETLPTLVFAREFAAECDQVLVPDGGRDWKLRWLGLAGIEARQVRWLNDLAHLECEQLVFTSRMVRHFEPNPWAIATLRSLLSVPAAPEAGRRSRAVWLDRTHMPARRVGWEPGLIARLRDFDPVRLDELAPAGVAARCAEIGVLAGFHGAALANMVFCPPGARVIEVLTHPNFPWYARLSQLCGHQHVAVPADDSSDCLEHLSHVIPKLVRET